MLSDLLQNMTKYENAKLSLYLCACGQTFRGENFKKHMATVRVKGEEAAHRIEKRVLYCIACKVKDNGEDCNFVHVHKGCAQTPLSKQEILRIIDGDDVDLRADLELSEDEENFVAPGNEQHLANAITNIFGDLGPPNQASTPQPEENEVLEQPPAAPALPVPALPASPAPTWPASAPAPAPAPTPASSHVVDNLREQLRREKSKRQRMEAHIKELQSENASLKVTLEKRKETYQQNTMLQSQNKHLTTRNNELYAQVQVCDERLKVERELVSATEAKRADLEAKLRTLEKELRDMLASPTRTTYVHYPFKGNRLAAPPLVYSPWDKDDTMECYSCDDVYCFHVVIQHSTAIRVDYQKPCKPSELISIIRK